MRKKNHHDIIEQVPPDYYQKGVKNNILQRTWHTRKMEEVLGCISYYPEKVLDVGCASGWFLSKVKKSYPKSECHGVDIYDKAISYGQKKYNSLTLSVSDAHKLPYKAKSFDLIICTEVLEHVTEPEAVLLEIKRVLKKDGRAVIELDSGSMLFSTVWFLWQLSKGGVWKHAHLHSFTIKKLEKLLKKTGFAVEKRKRFNIGMAMVFLIRKGDTIKA